MGWQLDGGFRRRIRPNGGENGDESLVQCMILCQRRRHRPSIVVGIPGVGYTSNAQNRGPKELDDTHCSLGTIKYTGVPLKQ